MKDLYETIGVEKTATADEIKKAYRDKSKKAHPDKGGNHDDFVSLNFAYQILIDQDSRDHYDKTGSTEKQDFEKFFQGFLEGVVWPAVINNPSLTETHMIEHIKSIAKEQIAGIKDEISKLAKELAKITTFTDRLRPNKGTLSRIEGFMKLKKTNTEHNIAQNKNLITNIEKCIYEIGEYGYEVEEKPKVESLHKNVLDYYKSQSQNRRNYF